MARRLTADSVSLDDEHAAPIQCNTVFGLLQKSPSELEFVAKERQSLQPTDTPEQPYRKSQGQMLSQTPTRNLPKADIENPPALEENEV